MHFCNLLNWVLQCGAIPHRRLWKERLLVIHQNQPEHDCQRGPETARYLTVTVMFTLPDAPASRLPANVQVTGPEAPDAGATMEQAVSEAGSGPQLALVNPVYCGVESLITMFCSDMFAFGFA